MTNDVIDRSAKGRITLYGDLNTAAPNTAALALFYDTLAQRFATYLGIAKALVQILAVRQGSIEVEFAILDGDISFGNFMTSEQLVDALGDVFSSGAFNVTFGGIMYTAVPGTFTNYRGGGLSSANKAVIGASVVGGVLCALLVIVLVIRKRNKNRMRQITVVPLDFQKYVGKASLKRAEAKKIAVVPLDFQNYVGKASLKRTDSKRVVNAW